MLGMFKSVVFGRLLMKVASSNVRRGFRNLVRMAEERAGSR